MFVSAGTAILNSFSRDYGIPLPACDATDNNSQFIGFLGGGAGFGKSHVVKALLHLVHSWNHPNAICTAAHQGIAAVNI